MGEIRDDNPVAGLTAYELRHLGEHLADAGEAAALEQLLALSWKLEPAAPPPAAGTQRRLRRFWRRPPNAIVPKASTARVRNAWYDAKEAINDAAGYRTDVNAAWRMAAAACAKALERGDRAPAGRELRCALLAASVASLESALPGELLRIMVERGAWSEAQALAYVRGADEQGQTKLTTLLPALSDETRAELVPRLLYDRRGADRPGNLQRIAPVLDADQGRLALAEAATYEQPEDRNRVAGAIALRLAELGHVEEAFEIATTRWAADPLDHLAPRLDERQVRAGLKLARTRTDDGSLPPASFGLIPRLAALGYVHEAFKLAREVDLPFYRGVLAREMAPMLDRELRERALELVPPYPGPGGDSRGAVLLALARAARSQQDDAAADALVHAAVDSIKAIEYEFARAEAIADAATELCAESPTITLDFARKIKSGQARLVALAAVAEHVHGHEREAVRELALAAVDHTTTELGADDIQRLASIDPISAAPIARNFILGYTGDRDQLVKLASVVPDELLAELRHAFERIDDEHERIFARIALAGERVVCGDPVGLAQLEQADRRGTERIEVVADIAGRVPDALIDPTVELIASLSGHDLEGPVEAIVARMSDQQRAALLEKIAASDYDWAYANAVKAIAPYLGAAMIEHTLNLALSRADAAWGAWALCHLAPRLELAQLERVCVRMRELGGQLEFQREALAAAVATRLAELGRADEAVTIAETIVRNPGFLAEAIGGVARCASANLHRLEALATGIADPVARAEVLGALATNAQAPDRSRLVDLAKQAAAGTPTAAARLARSIPELLGQALSANDPADDEFRAEVSALGPLSASERTDSIPLVRKTASHESRSEALVRQVESARAPTRELISEALGAVADEDSSILRESQLRTVLNALMTLGPSVAHAEWSAILPTLAQRGRKDFMSDVSAAARVVGMLGGLEAINDIEAAIADIEQWW